MNQVIKIKSRTYVFERNVFDVKKFAIKQSPKELVFNFAEDGIASDASSISIHHLSRCISYHLDDDNWVELRFENQEVVLSKVMAGKFKTTSELLFIVSVLTKIYTILDRELSKRERFETYMDYYKQPE